MSETKPLLCPKCGQPLKVVYNTHIFATKYCDVYEDGVELLSDEDINNMQSKANPPTMYVNDLCFIVGYYGDIEPEFGFFHSIGGVICPNCGRLLNHKVEKDKNGVYYLTEETPRKNGRRS